MRVHEKSNEYDEPFLLLCDDLSVHVIESGRNVYTGSSIYSILEIYTLKELGKFEISDEEHVVYCKRPVNYLKFIKLQKFYIDHIELFRNVNSKYSSLHIPTEWVP